MKTQARNVSGGYQRFVLVGVISITLLFAACSSTPTEEDTIEDSVGELTLANIDPMTFQPVGSDLHFVVSGAELAVDPEQGPAVFLNENLIGNNRVTVTANEIVLVGVLIDGRNHVEVVVPDTEGFALHATATLWAGAETLNVTLVDPQNGDFSSASVTLELSANDTMTASGAGPTVSFINVPARPVLLTASTTDGRVGSLPTVGNAQTAQITLEGLGAADPIDNNDFQQGTTGWNLGTAPVEVAPNEVDPTQNDLILSAPVPGAQTISRTFQAPTNAQTVTLTYRFSTDDIANSNLGSATEDQFIVSLRSATGQTQHAFSSSSLGSSAFDSVGDTDWRTITLPVAGGDTVRADITVVNGGLSAMASRSLISSRPAIVVDDIKTNSSSFRLDTVTLTDIDRKKTRIKYLSAGGSSTIFSGKTRVRGTLSIVGDENDIVNSVELQIMQEGKVLANATLVTAASDQLIGAIGPSLGNSVTTDSLLFELSTAEAAKLTGLTSRKLSLRVRVKLAPIGLNDAAVSDKDFGEVTLLVSYTASTRFGQRDTACGGDNWVLPGLKSRIERLDSISTSFTFNDISNMNAGIFYGGTYCSQRWIAGKKKGHGSHKNGFEIDALFSGYHRGRNQTASTANAKKSGEQILAYLKDPMVGKDIQLIYVNFYASSESAFWTALGTGTVPGKAGVRNVRDIVKQLGGHRNHFHVKFFKSAADNNTMTSNPCEEQVGPGYVPCPGEGGGQCIHESWLCDGEFDCPNMQDEASCQAAQ